MITYKISVKDGYMVDSDLPHNCIFNKARTGCGGTSIALNNGENYVVAVPTTELIINKCSSNDRCFGLYGNFTPKLKKELSDYIQQHECRKIICTYDKLPKLLALVDGKDYRLLVDEYHNFLKQYSFRDKAIDGVLDNFKAFKSFCFMSATPIENGLKAKCFGWRDGICCRLERTAPDMRPSLSDQQALSVCSQCYRQIQDARLFGSERA